MNFCLILLLLGLAAGAEQPAPTLADRAAIERVYHNHRTGTKQAFEQAMPPALLEQLVRTDDRKEMVLQQAYGVEVTPPMVEAEVQRINATTRAPEILAELKRALGDDPARFALSLARPIVVERILRERFDNDDRLHTAARAIAEQARQALLKKEPVEDMQEITWILTPRPSDEAPVTKPIVADPRPIASSSGSYSNEATAQLAQPLASAPSAAAPGLYFDELDSGLKNVLRVQLREAGDVSAVIETPRSFLVFQAKEKSATALTASSLNISKRSYDEWLANFHP